MEFLILKTFADGKHIYKKGDIYDFSINKESQKLAREMLKKEYIGKPVKAESKKTTK